MTEEALVLGTAGYRRAVKRFVAASQGLDFELICQSFVAYLPTPPARVLDLGAGAGQNAAALAGRGYQVTALEPVAEFIDAAKQTYSNHAVVWLQGSMPEMAALQPLSEGFDFVLIDGVWHHLDEGERERTVSRLAAMIKPGGRCAISLRNGPAGLGTRVCATDSDATVEQFNRQGFECLLQQRNLPSILPNKEQVKWDRIVVQKR